MSDYIRSELYKLIHRPYPYIVLGLCVIISMLINFAVWYSMKILNLPFSITGADMMGAGLYMIGSIIWYMIIFSTDIGFSGEWRNNTMKNSISFGTGRFVIFFGKTIINLLILVGGSIISIAFYVLTNFICFHNDGSLTLAVYSDYFFRFILMLPLIIGGQMLASSLCMFFSTDLLWCGIYAVIIALIPNGFLLINSLFPELKAVEIIYSYLPTTCLARLSWWTMDVYAISKAMIVSIIMITVPTIISFIVFSKKEIK